MPGQGYDADAGGGDGEDGHDGTSARRFHAAVISAVWSIHSRVILFHDRISPGIMASHSVQPT